MFFNKNLAINYLACIVFLLWNFQVSQATSKEQSNTSYIIKEFFPPNTIFNHLVFEESLGYVYIGAQNRFVLNIKLVFILGYQLLLSLLSLVVILIVLLSLLRTLIVF